MRHSLVSRCVSVFLFALVSVSLYGQSSGPQLGSLTAAQPFNGDVRTLSAANTPAINFSATPAINFDGLDFATWGSTHPASANGDAGPNYYIQAINASVGIYDKTNGNQIAAFTLNTFMSQGSFGNLCDTNNQGQPIVLYDTFEDRWIITDVAYTVDGSNNVINPPGEFQCFAVSKSGDPLAGGWNFYSMNVVNGIGDQPKLGVWPDGIYMAANVLNYPAARTLQNPRVWALNKQQMYAGAPVAQMISFDAPAADFGLLPSNARLQTGTPPSGTPNYVVSTWQFLNSLTVYKFHVDWNRTSLSTFTGPDQPLAATSWPNATVPSAPSLGGNSLNTVGIQAMMQNQYTNFGGVESLWTTHTVRRQNTSGFAAPRWYQVTVTGGTVAANLPQAATWDPDGANVMYRFIPSLALDRAGNMALGYSTSNSTTEPAIKYAGRLAGDPVNTFSQTEQLLIQGTGTQTGTCNGGSCTAWGQYSSMTLDVDGCSFWYTNSYYATNGLNNLTHIGTFKFPGCTTVGAGGTLQGTVTDSTTSNPIVGATVTFGSRSVNTDSSGNYSFTVPAGSYPSIAATYPGYNPGTASNIVITDGNTTTQNFALMVAPTSGCLTDTSQADFLTGTFTNCDLTTSPGDVTLNNAPAINQQNTTLGTSGVGITTTTWGGQTFTPSATGSLVRVDINLFCSGCTGTTPNLTLSLRATSGGLPTGPDLASATITGFSNGGAASFFTVTFSTPPTLTAGTQYALVIRPTSNPSPGTYALTRSGTSTAGSNVYAGGTRVSGATSGTVWSIPLTGGVSTDAGFKVYLNTGFPLLGTFTSSVKDANPAVGGNAGWTTLSWTASTPANTNIQFQVATSNNPNGPFSFVGPDGTASTFFTTSGASLSGFSGRYLKYQASLATTDNTVTPTLNDVTVCFSNLLPTTLNMSAASGTYGGTVNLSATLLSNSAGVSSESVSFSINGNNVGTATTNSSGVASLNAVSLSGINANTYLGGITASFSGDSTYASSSTSSDLTVAKANQTITFGPLSNATYGDPDFNVSATSDSTLTVTFGATGNCTIISSSTVHLTGPGPCTITASQSGNTNYNAATDVPQSFTISGATPPSLSKAFGTSQLPVTWTTSLSFTIQNPNVTATLTGIGFSDALPTGLVLATPVGLTGSCGGGTISAVGGASTISLSGATLTAGSSCNFSVQVMGTAAGTKTNTTGSITANESGVGGTASATIDVLTPPTVAIAFNPTTIPVNGTTTLTFTIANPSANGAAVSPVTLNDILPSGLTVSSVVKSDPCSLGSGVLHNTAPTTIQVGGITIPVNSQCVFSVTITGTVAGQYTNTTGTISSGNAGSGGNASANLTVASAPTIAAAFASGTVALNHTVGITYTLANPNSSTGFTGLGFTNTLPAGLTFVNPSTSTNNCGGTVTGAAGGNTLTLSGGTVGTSTTCTVIATVTGVAAGTQNNVTGTVSSTEGGTGGTASSSIDVLAPPVLAAAFNPTSIALNGTTTFTYTLANPAANPDPLTSAGVTDSLPSGLTVATATVNNLCGPGNGTLTTTAPSSIVINNVTLAVSGQCQIPVTVTGAVAGAYTYTTGAPLSANGGTGAPVIASLNVATPQLAIVKTHTGNFAFGSTGTYSITVSNSGTIATDGTIVTVVDALPGGNPAVTATTMSGTGWTCNLGTLTCTRNDILAGSASYPVIMLTVSVPEGAAASFTNTATVTGGGDSTTHTATDPTNIVSTAMKITLTQTGISVYDGQSGSLTFNLDTGGASGPVTLSCSGLPLGASCGFSPSTITQSGTVILTISTLGRVSQISSKHGDSKLAPIYAGLTIPGLGLAIVLVGRKRSRKAKIRLLGILGGVMLLLCFSGCGSGTTYGTPAGSYPIAVTATSANGNATTTVTLNVLRYLSGNELGK